MTYNKWCVIQLTQKAILVKGHGFLSFAKNMDKSISKNVSKNLGNKYSPGVLAVGQRLLDHAKESSRDTFKTASKNQFKKKNRNLTISLVTKLLIKL